MTGSAEGDARLAYVELHEETTEVTRLLCELCRLVESSAWTDKGQELVLPKRVKVWWKKHQRIDATRRRAEENEIRDRKLAAAAKKKLTPKERKALGL